MDSLEYLHAFYKLCDPASESSYIRASGYTSKHKHIIVHVYLFVGHL